MPSVNSSSCPTLKTTCIDSICTYMDEIWCKSYLEQLKAKGSHFMFVLGPFNEIPPQLSEQILKQLRCRKLIKKHHYDILVTPSTRVLDLAAEQNDVGHPLTLAAIRTSSCLKVLNLSCCQKIPKKILKEAISCLPNLEVLDLSGTICNDDILSVVGAYGTKLRDLNVASCKDVSDSGISALCFTMNDLGSPDSRLGKCNQLQKLNISHTRVTDSGIRTALVNLPQLCVFECANTVGVLAQIHRKDWENGAELPKYKLLDLQMETGAEYVESSFHIAATLCPDVVKLKISCCEDVTDRELLSFLSLNRVNELHLGGERDTAVTFYGGILPLLQAHGQRLIRLTLAELSDVNVELIGQFCPNLKQLNLILNNSYSAYRPISLQKPEKLEVFRHLKTLHLVCQTHLRLDSDVPSLHVMELLTSPNLKYVYIRECQTLADETILQVLDLNGFEFLEHLEVEQCDSLTGGAMERFLYLGSPLKALKTWSCKNITRRDHQRYTSITQENKLKIKVEWM